MNYLITKPQIYMRNQIKKEVFDCLDKLYHLKKIKTLNQAYRFGLFPTVEEVKALDNYFSSPLNHYDLYGKKGNKRVV